MRHATLRMSCFAAGIFTFAATATAADNERLPFYLGIDFTRLSTKVADKTGTVPDASGTARGSTLRIRGGAHLSSWLDAEFDNVFPSDGTYSHTAVGNTVRTEIFGVFVKPKFEVGPAIVYGRLGASTTEIELDGTYIVAAKTSTSGFAYGLGAGYLLTKKVVVSIEYCRYNKGKADIGDGSAGLDVTSHAMSAGITYTF